MRNSYFLLILLAFCGCEKTSNEPKPPVTIDMPEVSMNYDGSHQFVLNQGSVRIQATDYTWTVSNPTTGSISDAGLFTAKRIGDTFIYGTPKTVTGDKVSARVSVKPYFTTWGPVITTFGVNRSSVKLAEKRSFRSEDATGLVYYGENDKVRAVVYMFKTDQLASSGVLPENTSANAKEIAVFLKERYDYKGVTDGIYVFTDNKTVNIALTVDDSIGLIVLYAPYTKGGRLAAHSPDGSVDLSRVPADPFDKTALNRSIQSVLN